MRFRLTRLRDWIILGVVLLVVFGIFTTYGIWGKLLEFAKRYWVWLLFAGCFMLIVILLYYSSRKEYAQKELSKKAFEFLNHWWCHEMGTGEEFTLEATIFEEGLGYDKEKLFSINTLKKGTNERFLALVGTSPMRIVYWNNNSHQIKERSSAFDNYRYLFKKEEPDQEYYERKIKLKRRSKLVKSMQDELDEEDTE